MAADRLSEQAIAAAVRQLALADVWALLRGEGRDVRPAVLTALLRPRKVFPLVGADEPCPDCEAPAGRLCHHWCPRYAEDPGLLDGGPDE